MRTRSRSLVSRWRSSSKNRRDTSARSSSPRRSKSLTRRFVAAARNEANNQEHDEPSTEERQKPSPQRERPTLKWKSVVDQASGRLYYYHRLTRISTWTKPKDFFSDARPEDPVKTHSFPTQLLSNLRKDRSFSSFSEGPPPRRDKRKGPKNGNQLFGRSLSFGTSRRRSRPLEISYQHSVEVEQNEKKHEEKHTKPARYIKPARSFRATAGIQGDENVKTKGHKPKKSRTRQQRGRSKQPRQVLPMQDPEEVFEGQEVLWIQEDETVIGEEVQETTDDETEADYDEEEEEVDECEDQQIEVEPVFVKDETEKKKFRFSRNTKKRHAKNPGIDNNNNLKAMQVKVESQAAPETLPATNQGLNSLQDVAAAIAESEREEPRQRPTRGRKKSASSTHAPGRVLLLPTEHSMQEAAWNEEQARKLLLKALHTSNMDRRRELCHKAFDHAHEAVDLRQEANDDMIGLIIDPGKSTYKSSRRSASTLTVSTVTASTYQDTFFGSESYESGILDQVQALKALDDLCGLCLVDDGSVNSNSFMFR